MRHVVARQQAVTAAWVALISGLAGCGGSGSSSTSASKPVTAESFVAAAAPAVAPHTGDTPAASTGTPAAPTGKSRSVPVPPPAPVAVTDATLNTTSTIGRPGPANPAAVATKSPVVLESLVGQINGRPVFASEVLEPLDDELRAKAKSAASRKEWQQDALKKIVGSVRRLINDELILAEARASLTPEQKQGLLFFLNKIQEDVVSQQQGSQVAADEAARASQGLSLQQASKDRLDRELISNEIKQRISPRVIVSWRLIQQEYERNAETYHPRPVATYRLVSVKSAKPDMIEKVKADLAAGKSIAEIAESDVNDLAAADGGRQTRTLTGKPDEKLFPIPDLDSAAKTLTSGQVAGPITVGATNYWIGLESIEQPPEVSLYEAQLDIERQLRERRFDLEADLYFDRLRKRGNVSKVEDMVARLMTIAEQRYFTGSPAPTTGAAQ